jgi:ribosomal protein S18 acetylase RimI-like enzyme
VAATGLLGKMTIRDATEADAGAMAQVEVATWGAAYAGILPPARLAAMSVPRAQARWLRVLGMRGRGTALVGTIEDEVVAFASGGSADAEGRRMARLDTLYVRPEHQRRGLGRALTREIATRMSEANITALWVDVLAKNAHGRRFYRALGAIELSRTWSFLGTTPIVVVAYGWSLPEGLARIG